MHCYFNKYDLHVQVGPTYGRKMMQGKLAAENLKVHDKRISSSLKRVAPTYSRQREQNTAKLLNLTKQTILVTRCTLTKMRSWLCMGAQQYLQLMVTVAVSWQLLLCRLKIILKSIA